MWKIGWCSYSFYWISAKNFHMRSSLYNFSVTLKRTVVVSVAWCCLFILTSQLNWLGLQYSRVSSHFPCLFRSVTNDDWVTVMVNTWSTLCVKCKDVTNACSGIFSRTICVSIRKLYEKKKHFPTKSPNNWFEEETKKVFSLQRYKYRSIIHAFWPCRFKGNGTYYFLDSILFFFVDDIHLVFSELDSICQL